MRCHDGNGEPRSVTLHCSMLRGMAAALAPYTGSRLLNCDRMLILHTILLPVSVSVVVAVDDELSGPAIDAPKCCSALCRKASSASAVRSAEPGHVATHAALPRPASLRQPHHLPPHATPHALFLWSANLLVILHGTLLFVVVIVIAIDDALRRAFAPAHRLLLPLPLAHPRCHVLNHQRPAECIRELLL